MAIKIKRIAQRLLKRLGYKVVRAGTTSNLVDLEASDVATITRVSPFTMTSQERLYSVIQATRYIVQSDIPGDIVECGVWKGGSVMTSLMTLMDMNHQDRHVYLYDTYEGMTKPTSLDVDYSGNQAIKKFSARQTSEDSSRWVYSPLDEVKQNVLGLGYDESKIHFVKGKVEDTIPSNAPEVIALLRLDTDWYESTAHSLTHLFPRLAPGGVLILDDYGHWQGVRRAVDEYVSQNNIKILLNRVDYTGRVGIKL